MNTYLNSNTILVFQKAIKREQASMTNFGHANDRLSRCVSEMMKCQRNWQEAAEMDYYFDYGEWSGKACAEAMHNELLAIVSKYNFASVSELAKAVTDATNSKFTYELGLFFLE